MSLLILANYMKLAYYVEFIHCNTKDISPIISINELYQLIYNSYNILAG
ncbi:hypothetical protein A1OE_393 [Candidatus Endolissoclinum faulkneri L2]|uniref:Uncharacterized protein n=1 Tax=Candidatus Endolissoclinum faulkneri L2 TaxID=1193729 RepID=K7Z3M4_9PROT|nr:hypothetical protein A1OE_393 [Candidatus Endolissoclinum faulkneri L2]